MSEAEIRVPKGSNGFRTTRVATDAIDEDEARRVRADATSSVNGSSMGSGHSPDRRFVFPITIALDRGDLRIGDALVPPSRGMSFTAEIKADRQSIVDDVLSPLTQMISEAPHES